jgi:hypothetical protein
MTGSNGIVPTVDLATNNAYPYMGGSFGNAFGGDGIWALVLLALLFGNNGWGNGFGGGFNNIATTDYISSEFTQRDVNNGFQNTNNLVSNGFSDTATNICNLRSEVLENRYANQLAEANTQRDILSQTNELNTNLLTTQLNAQAQMDKCCCDLRAQGIENTQKILDAMSQNTIDDLRSQVNDLKNTITANGIGTSIVNQVRPYPIPAYPVSSPYTGFYGFNNGFYGNGFFGNTIV